MSLLVVRDHLCLVNARGESRLSEAMPEFLYFPLLAQDLYCASVEKKGRRTLLKMTALNDRGVQLLEPGEDPFREAQKEVKKTIKQNKEWYDPENDTILPALWSGYRSALVKDPATKELYRLKGIAFTDPPIVHRGKDYKRIWGGQTLRNAKFEKKYSDLFNRTLVEHNIEPVMNVVGIYTFPIRVDREQLATSVIHVKGDTRLDELIYALETEYRNLLTIPKTKERESLEKLLPALYSTAGFMVGQLKSLMDESGQSWSDNSQRSNAHIGNVVLYPDNDGSGVGVGLVDFDASCERKEMSPKKLSRLQRSEYKNLRQGANEGLITFREPLNVRKDTSYSFADAYADGFEIGYLRDTVLGANGKKATIGSALWEEIQANVMSGREKVEEDGEKMMKVLFGPNELK